MDGAKKNTIAKDTSKLLVYFSYDSLSEVLILYYFVGGIHFWIFCWLSFVCFVFTTIAEVDKSIAHITCVCMI